VSRVQLALNVSDLDAAIDFYSKLFGAIPAKRMAGYANFAIADPPLKLVLIESHEPHEVGVINHLGVEVQSTEEVATAARRLTEEGLVATAEESTTCCYAVQTKVWVHDPDGAPWEIYTVLADAPASTGPNGGGTCCASEDRELIHVGAKGQSACC
jgi:catechol 2,3-dioxygenase-like lactoylglutathione lyase family enzyme